MARIDHLQHPKASCLRRLNTPTAGALVASISTYNERKESSRNSLNRGTFRCTRGGRLSAYLHIISLSDAGRSSNCRHECLSPYNLFEPLIQCNITFPSRLTTARCYWELFSLLFLHCFIYRRSMPTLQPWALLIREFESRYEKTVTRYLSGFNCRTTVRPAYANKFLPDMFRYSPLIFQRLKCWHLGVVSRYWH